MAVKLFGRNDKHNYWRILLKRWNGDNIIAEMNTSHLEITTPPATLSTTEFLSDTVYLEDAGLFVQLVPVLSPGEIVPFGPVLEIE